MRSDLYIMATELEIVTDQVRLLSEEYSREKLAQNIAELKEVLRQLEEYYNHTA